MISEDANDAIDTYVREQMKSQHIPGLSLAVIQNGQVIKASGYGLANLETDVAATPNTVYQIGSITKQFTATAILQLAEEGKLDIEDPICCFLDTLPESWQEVTVRQLLNHTSGIKSFTNVPDLINRIAPLPATREEVLATVSAEPLEFAPGTKYAYNNTGYYLLGHIIEAVSGQTYATFLQERIFQPLGMDATRINVIEDIIPNRASGYGWAEEGWQNALRISMDWVYAAGAMVSTVLDLAKWDAALGSETLLPHARWESMWSPTILADGTPITYGFGWALGDYHGHHKRHHGGGIPGFITYAGNFPEDNLAVIVLTNIAPSLPEKIAHGVAGHYVPDLIPAERMAAGTDTNPNQTQELRGVLDALAKNEESSVLTDSYRRRLERLTPEEKAHLAEQSSGITDFVFLGEREISGTSRNQEDCATIRFHKSVAGEATRYWVFYLTADGKIADIVIE